VEVVIMETTKKNVRLSLKVVREHFNGNENIQEIEMGIFKNTELNLEQKTKELNLLNKYQKMLTKKKTKLRKFNDLERKAYQLFKTTGVKTWELFMENLNNIDVE
jgi:hypothetical protein